MKIRDISIRHKIMAVVIFSTALFTLFLYALSINVLPQSYSNIEETFTMRNVERAHDAIENIFPQMQEKLRDWAQWDDTYEFIQGTYDEYITDNLDPGSIANLNINVMVFADESGNVRFLKAIDIENEEEISMPDLEEYLSKHKNLLSFTDPADRVIGIVPLPSGPFLFASQPILTSYGEGPIAGTLAFGRYLDADVVDSVSSVTHLPIEVFLFEDPELPSDVQVAKEALAYGTGQVVTPLSKDTIAGYRLIRDINDVPFLILRIESERSIFKQGQFTSRFFLLTTVVLICAFGLILVFLLEYVVISRFTHLGNQMKQIGDKHDLSLRVQESAKDEVGMLASSVNYLLDKIVVYEKSEKNANEKNQALTEKLQKNLEESGKLNQFMVDREIKMVELKKENERLKAELEKKRTG